MTRRSTDMRLPQESPNQEVLAGLIERVTYHNAENGFCVLRARVRAGIASLIQHLCVPCGRSMVT
jgi:hypothetical protein